MEFLSWLFFCMSPVALFCTENGSGLILCPVFIMLGFVFKRIENNSNGTHTVAVKVDSQKFWEWHYKDRIRDTLAEKDSIDDHLMSAKDKEARSWATTVCGYHNAWVPPEGKQEQIARENGVITEKMIKERDEKRNRVQIGKYFLMRELEQKYRGKKCGKGGRGESSCFPEMIIDRDCHRLKLSNGSAVSEWMVKHDYNMTVRQMWDSLTEQEKQQTTEWIRKYEEKLLKYVKAYIEEGCYFHNVDIEF